MSEGFVATGGERGEPDRRVDAHLGRVPIRVPTRRAIARKSGRVTAPCLSTLDGEIGDDVRSPLVSQRVEDGNGAISSEIACGIDE